ncbi:hypothetical protein [Paenibacillus cremeus]|uniref:hypothetical protein n=1 Tax=Paenibacillus cremeus TaxID=2163881 RepID=UPI0016459EE6|nr:hypothetical protein [Paenibacillus cremeus]
MSSEKIVGLNQVREALFAIYPNATKITVTIDGDKIKVAPNEEYEIPVGGYDSEE